MTPENLDRETYGEMLSALRQAQATIHATWKSLGLSKDGDVAKVFQAVSQAIAKAESL